MCTSPHKHLIISTHFQLTAQHNTKSSFHQDFYQKATQISLLFRLLHDCHCAAINRFRTVQADLSGSIRHIACLALLHGKSLAYLYGRAGEECDFQKQEGLHRRDERNTRMRCGKPSDHIGFLSDEQSCTLYCTRY